MYVGGTTILMSPLSFLQRPERWLRAISDHGAVVSGGPNFAYELCLRKIKPEEMEGLDLSSWRVAFSGAEPIRAKLCGDLRRFLVPADSPIQPSIRVMDWPRPRCLVTGGQGPGKVTTCSVQAAELQENGRVVAVEPNANQRESSIELVGCGHALMDEEVLIVDPETPDCLAMIMSSVKSGSAVEHVARGYRNRSPESEETFHGQLADSRKDSFLRSGDLGFIRDGSLFVTGRRKELLIIRGRNHYPHDLEATVQNSHEKLIPGGGGSVPD